MPHLSSRQLGEALLATATLTWFVPVTIQIRSLLKGTYYRATHAAFRAVLVQIATVPGIWSGLALCGVLPGTITAFAAGVIISMLVAMFNAWVLLVEIIR